MSELTLSEYKALSAYHPCKYKQTSGVRTHVQVFSIKYRNLALYQLGMGEGIGGGLGYVISYVLSNRLKYPTVTRHALMSVTFGILGHEVVQFTGLKVIRVFSLGRSEVGDLNDI